MTVIPLIVSAMIEGGTLTPLTDEEQGKLIRHLENGLVPWIVEEENKREYLQ